MGRHLLALESRFDHGAEPPCDLDLEVEHLPASIVGMFSPTALPPERLATIPDSFPMRELLMLLVRQLVLVNSVQLGLSILLIGASWRFLACREWARLLFEGGCWLGVALSIALGVHLGWELLAFFNAEFASISAIVRYGIAIGFGTGVGLVHVLVCIVGIYQMRADDVREAMQ
jgi:uncharacterized membrane protein (DUF485 family)